MYIIHNEKVLTYIDYQPVYKGLNVTEFGEETNDCDSHNSALCYRHNHIVHFVLEGTGCFYRDGKTFSLSKGKAFVITPENLIRYEEERAGRTAGSPFRAPTATRSSNNAALRTKRRFSISRTRTLRL